jgi:hypothetical protein
MFSFRDSSNDSDQPLHLLFHLSTRHFNPPSALFIVKINVAPLPALEVQNSLPFQVTGSGQPKFISLRSTRVPPQGPRHPSDTKLVQIYTAVSCAPQTHQPVHQSVLPAIGHRRAQTTHYRNHSPTHHGPVIECADPAPVRCFRQRPQGLGREFLDLAFARKFRVEDLSSVLCGAGCRRCVRGNLVRQ